LCFLLPFLPTFSQFLGQMYANSTLVTWFDYFIDRPVTKFAEHRIDFLIDLDQETRSNSFSFKRNYE